MLSDINEFVSQRKIQTPPCAPSFDPLFPSVSQKKDVAFRDGFAWFWGSVWPECLDSGKQVYVHWKMGTRWVLKFLFPGQGAHFTGKCVRTVLKEVIPEWLFLDLTGPGLRVRGAAALLFGVGPVALK